MAIEIAKLTRMLEAEKAALEGWGGLSDVEKAAYVAANPGSFVATSATKPAGGKLVIEDNFPKKTASFLKKVGAPVHKIEPATDWRGEGDHVHTEWHPGNAHAIHRYIMKHHNPYHDEYHNPTAYGEKDNSRVADAYHNFLTDPGSGVKGGDKLHKYVKANSKPGKVK